MPESATFEAIQTQELDDDSLLKDTLSVTVKGDEKLLNAEYMAVKSYTGNAQTFDMYRIVADTTPDKSMSFTGMSLAPYELNGHIIQDLRPVNHSLEYTLNRVLDGTDWQLGYIDDGLQNVTTTFYYVSAKEALKELQSLVGCEFVFKVEISGQKITDKWIEVYSEMGNRTKKRFNYGTNALTVVRETNKADIYTALIGRGKGEEVSSGEDNESGQAGYGRKITFEDIEWSTAKGNPLNKPVGQYYLELPQATQAYGIKNIDGTMKARVGIVDFDDEEDKNRLINLTYQQLLVSSRPKVLFKTTVANVGATGIGDTVTIHRHDLNIHYQTRVRKIVRNKLNDNKTQIELGDAVVTASTKQTKQNNATIKNLNQEIEKVKADVSISQTSADGKNTITYGPVEPERKRTGDTWYRPHPSIAGETQMLVWNGTAWELVVDSSNLTSVSKEVEEAAKVADEAIQSAQDAVGQIDTAVANAGFTSLDDTIKNVSGIASGVKNELDIAIENAGFTSLDDTLRNMNDITVNAGQNAQQAITNASNAYGLAQTSISEAQTAQANALTALGKADSALDGVSNLDIRVDDVEAELELKADNTFVTEDGTLTTLSNAITFNANRFSSDMSRIESRVESLAGEINLVILKDAHVGKVIRGTDIYPNPTEDATDRDTMRDLIEVSPNEQLAFSKKAGSGWARIHQYDESYNNIQYLSFQDDERLVTTLPNAKYIWISYPRGGQPQLIRGTDFLPYRPNLVDQMTSDEVVLFRNEYDEFADRTERRLTAIDSSGGRLETAEALITKTAESLKSTVGKVDNQGGRLSTVEQTASGLQKIVADKASQSQVTQLATGLNALVENKPKNLLTNGDFSNENVMHGWSTDTNVTFNRMLENVAEFYSSSGQYLNRVWNDLTLETGKKYKITIDARASVTGRTISLGQFNGLYNETIVLSSNLKTYEVIYEASNNSRIGIYFNVAGTYGISNVKVVETTAISKGQIRVLSDSITQSISSLDGRVNAQIQTLESSLSAINDPITGRLSIVEQTASGLQKTVADKASQSQVTQLANGLSSVVESLPDSLIPDSNNLTSGRWGGWLTDLSISFNRSINEKTELFVGSQGARIWYPSVNVEQGKKYKITFDIRSNVTGRKVSVGGWEPDKHRIGISSTSQSYEAVFEPRSTDDFSIYFYDTGTYEIGNVRVFETRLISETQISQLADNINLRVTKGDLLSQINVQAGGVLIQSGTNKLNVTTETTYIEDGTIKSAMIESLEAGKIKTGTLDAGKVKVINIDAENITSNKTSFVQSAWNAINSNLSVNGSELRYTHSDGSYTRMNANGIQTVVGGSAYQHNYLTHVSNVTINSGSAGNVQWVQLPSVFKGKDFTYFMGATDIYGAVTETDYFNNKMMLKRFVLIKHPDYNVDYANARIPILGYAHYANIDSRKDYFRALQGIVFAQY